ncbi:hypothetical protein BDV3_001073 [Batrachochytrium dendrobatidis]|nr:diphosphomevalonate decarboxylase [Batrachochytrium dendrobatidis]
MTTIESTGLQVTCSAPVNIAVVKYWGKRDTQLLLPTNSSLSVTLSQDHLRSTTTIHTATDASLERDRLWLNHSEVNIAASSRLRNVLAEARRLRRTVEEANPTLPILSTCPLHIASVNNFPTAAGLASSASGFACMVYALDQLFELNGPNTQTADLQTRHLSDLSRLARIGSGSACRSLFGGFVAWDMGDRLDGLDSVAVQVDTELHWPDLEALILVVSDAQKDTGSTVGMQRTVETSALLQHRIHHVVPDRMVEMTNAIHCKDFDTFAKLTMQDSNQFHAVCLDTFPPISYMNDISRAIVRLITAYNDLFTVESGTAKGYRVAYTFDAGPNAVLYLPRKHVAEVLGLINHFFPQPTTAFNPTHYFGRAAEYLPQVDSTKIASIAEKISFSAYPAGSLQRIISTHVGDGPRLLARGFDPKVSLLDQSGNLI